MSSPDSASARLQSARPLYILLVEEHRALANCLQRYLKSRGHRITHVLDLTSAKATLADGHFDLLLSDIESPAEGELLLVGCPELRPRFVLTMSAFDGAEMPPPREGAVRHHHLLKPFAIEELEVILERLVEELVWEEERSRPREVVPPLVATILREASRRRDAGELSPVDFEQKLERLTREELAVRGLELVVRPLSWGSRYLIKQRCTGRVCDMIDWYTPDRNGLNEKTSHC